MVSLFNGERHVFIEGKKGENKMIYIVKSFYVQKVVTVVYGHFEIVIALVICEIFPT